MFPTDCGELGANMEDHDGSHNQRNDVGEVCGALEDGRICQLNGASVALGGNAGRAGDVGWRTNEHAERQGCLLANSLKISETHLGEVYVLGLGGGRARIERRWFR